MNEPAISTFEVNGLRMRVAVEGTGPLVVLCHGFPELWYSWRHQLGALAAAGYRAVAPDMRGYGGTDAPADIGEYTQLHLVADMVDLVRTLGEKEAVIVGHDWGAPVAWHSALLRPDMFRAVVGLSVVYSPPSRTDLLMALRQQGVEDFYIQYFQTPGLAEAELERDVETTIRRIHFNGSGDASGAVAFGRVKAGRGLLGSLADPDVLPAWLTKADIADYATEFARTGFRGALNWYRNISRSRELLAPWRGQPIAQPSMFIAGARDDVLKFPGTRARIENLSGCLPGLRGCHLIEGAGHWIQRERAALVSELLVKFLNAL